MTSLKTKTSFFINNLSLFSNSFKNSKFKIQHFFFWTFSLDFLLHLFWFEKGVPVQAETETRFALFCVNWTGLRFYPERTQNWEEKNKQLSNIRSTWKMDLKIEIRKILTLFCFGRSESNCKVQSKVFYVSMVLIKAFNYINDLSSNDCVTFIFRIRYVRFFLIYDFFLTQRLRNSPLNSFPRRLSVCKVWASLSPMLSICIILRQFVSFFVNS